MTERPEEPDVEHAGERAEEAMRKGAGHEDLDPADAEVLGEAAAAPAPEPEGAWHEGRGQDIEGTDPDEGDPEEARKRERLWESRPRDDDR